MADGRRTGDPTAISLFSGALGLDLGLEQAGFDVRVAVEAGKWQAETIRTNRPSLPVIEERIENVPTKEILRRAGLRVGEATIISAGPSCQSFSTAGQRRSLDDPRGTLFRQFLRVVDEARPRFFCMEQVKGVLSAAVRHRRLNERGPGFPPLAAEEQLGSAIRTVVEELAAINYYTVFNLINVADYGVGQMRWRVIFMGSRDGEHLALPPPTHAEFPTDGQQPWVPLKTVLDGLDEDPDGRVAEEFSESRRKLIAQVPAGGNWTNLPAELQREAIGKAYDSWGGRSGFLRRLSWERPAPALTTRPASKATMLGHPDELRPLSVAEYARIQGFPDEWRFMGGLSNQYEMLGNAVPPPLGRAIGEQFMRLINAPKRNRWSKRGVVASASQDLLDRFSARSRTVVNPPRMRAIKGTRELRAWIQESGGGRRDPLDVEVLDEAA